MNETDRLLAEVADLHRRLNEEALRAERCLTQLMHAKRRQDLVVAALTVKRAQIAAVREQHYEDGGCCVTCTDEHDNRASWPCLTIAALAHRPALSPSHSTEEQG